VPQSTSWARRLDALIITATSGDVLVNHGFGAFLPDLDADTGVHSSATGGAPALPRGRLAAETLVTAADLRRDKFDDLVILTPAGHLFALANPPF
jgi:hypothetical protein